MAVGVLTAAPEFTKQIYDDVSEKIFGHAPMREDDALNKEACQWARGHLDRFPVDRRPLKRRQLNLHVEPVGGQGPPGAVRLRGQRAGVVGTQVLDERRQDGLDHP